jgi:carboxyl-terminal processing protease
MRALSLDIIYPQRSDYVGIYQRVTRAQAARMIYKMDLVTLGSAYSNGLPQISTYTPELDKIIGVWEIIESSYLEQDAIDKAALADIILKELVDQLDDPYSVYMDQEENANFLDSLDGEIEGIGAVVGFNENDEVTIISPIKGSPADRAGLKAKDVIIAVDDQIISGMSLEDVVQLIKGPRGTTVKIKIKRSTTYKTVIIERELIEIPSVEYELIDGGKMMHIIFSQFNYGASNEFQLALNELNSDSNIKGLIIDLRANPGGLLDESLRILGHYVEAQEEVVTINYVDYTQVLLSRGPADLNSFPTVVLIDEGSASASEIVAGTLQDYDLATIVGETSYGKGTVQEVIYFIDNSSLKLTVAEWLTPLHQSIQDGGIEPDIQIADDESTEKDEQLERAMQELSKMMY